MSWSLFHVCVWILELLIYGTSRVWAAPCLWILSALHVNLDGVVPHYMAVHKSEKCTDFSENLKFHAHQHDMSGSFHVFSMQSACGRRQHRSTWLTL